MVRASLTPCWSSRPPGARQQGSAQVEKNVTANSPNYVLTSWMLMSGAEFELAFVTSASSVSVSTLNLLRQQRSSSSGMSRGRSSSYLSGMQVICLTTQQLDLQNKTFLSAILNKAFILIPEGIPNVLIATNSVSEEMQRPLQEMQKHQQLCRDLESGVWSLVAGSQCCLLVV